MRKIILMLASCVIMLPALMACGACACSSGSNYLGVLPQFHKNLTGLRWNHRSFESHSGSETEASSETFNTVELWGRFYPAKRVQLFAFVPVHFFERNIHQASQYARGLGDISLIANYTIVNTGDSLRSDWKHLLLAGGGIKLPTGRKGVTDGVELLPPAMQPGTGSVDFLLNTIYTVRIRQFGIQTDAEYRLNTRNKNEYRFGNRFSAATRVFYWKKAGNFSFLPSAGLFFEMAGLDSDSRYAVTESGGEMLLGMAGLDIYFKRFVTGFNYLQPVHHHLADGQIKARARWLLSAAYMF